MATMDTTMVRGLLMLSLAILATMGMDMAMVIVDMDTMDITDMDMANSRKIVNEWRTEKM